MKRHVLGDWNPPLCFSQVGGKHTHYKQTKHHATITTHNSSSWHRAIRVTRQSGSTAQSEADLQGLGLVFEKVRGEGRLAFVLWQKTDPTARTAHFQPVSHLPYAMLSAGVNLAWSS